MHTSITQRAELEGKLFALGAKDKLANVERWNFVFHFLVDIGKSVYAAKRAKFEVTSNAKVKASLKAATAKQHVGKFALKGRGKGGKGKGKGKGKGGKGNRNLFQRTFQVT